MIKFSIAVALLILGTFLLGKVIDYIEDLLNGKR